MPFLLALETATPVCSVSLAQDNRLLAVRETSDPNAHSSVLTSFMEEVLQVTGMERSALDAIAVSIGPGSYTGLRIGLAAAKGFCCALDKPLIAVPTLQAMALGINEEWRTANSEFIRNSLSPLSGAANPASGTPYLICPMIDARRMEVYCAIFDDLSREVRETRAEIINKNSFADWLSDYRMLFAGSSTQKSKPILSSQPNAIFLDDFQPSSRYLIPLAEERLKNQRFENLAYCEPFYLKDFIAGKSRVKGLT